MMLRKCNHCGLEAHSEVDLELFVSNKKCDHGKRNLCKSCQSNGWKSWYVKNKERVIETASKWNKDNKERNNKFTQNWRKKYPHKVNALTAKRRAAKLQATPPWFEQERKRLEFLYATAKATGMHVDHIIPLQNELVCGLHCLGNLQLLTPTENISKGNKF